MNPAHLLGLMKKPREEDEYVYAEDKEDDEEDEEDDWEGKTYTFSYFILQVVYVLKLIIN